jgi:hypothetical protein
MRRAKTLGKRFAVRPIVSMKLLRLLDLNSTAAPKCRRDFALFIDATAWAVSAPSTGRVAWNAKNSLDRQGRLAMKAAAGVVHITVRGSTMKPRVLLWLRP